MLVKLTKIFGVSFAILALGKLVTLLAHVAMAREVGSVAFGEVSVALNWGILLATAFSFGFQSAGTRIVTTYVHQRDWGKLRGFIRLGARLLIGSSLAVALACGLWAFTRDESQAVIMLLIAAMFPSMLSSFVRGGVMRGLGDVVGSIAPYELIGPSIALAILLVASVDSGLAVGLIFALGLILAEVFGYAWLARVLPRQLHGATTQTDYRYWIDLSGTVHLVMVARQALQRIDLILVGAFLGLEAAGLYAAAQRVALSVAFAGRVTSHVASPRLALAYKVSPAKVLHETRDALFFSAAVGVTVFVIVAWGASYFLGLFGSEFRAASTILIILSFGQLFNALMSPVNLALLMTSFERFQMKLTVVAFLLTMIAYVVMIPLFGVLGGAIASTLGLVGINVAAYAFGYVRLKRSITANEQPPS